MTNFDKIKSMNLEEFVMWLNSYETWDEAPWINWWNENYCKKCNPETVKIKASGIEMECAWCELHDKCKFFQELDDTPDCKTITKLWLKEKFEEKTEKLEV